MNNKRICIDVDGTICHFKQPGQTYDDVLPLSGAAEALQQLKSEGWEIVISTARGQSTYNNNTGKVTANTLFNLINWLKKWNIPYDEIWQKPNCEFFIDDRGIEFNNWANVLSEINNRCQLPTTLKGWGLFEV